LSTSRYSTFPYDPQFVYSIVDESPIPYSPSIHTYTHKRHRSICHHQISHQSSMPHLKILRCCLQLNAISDQRTCRYDLQNATIFKNIKTTSHESWSWVFYESPRCRGYFVQESARILRLIMSNILGTHGAIPMEDKTRWNKSHQHRKDLVIKLFLL